MSTSLAKWRIPLSFILAIACTQSDEDDRDPFNDRLVVLTRNAPTTYYFDKENQTAGFEFDLARDFAKFLGKKIEFKVLDSTSEILDQLKRNQAHFAAAGLAKTVKREKEYAFGPEFMTIEQQVVCQSGLRVHRKRDLIGRTIVVPANTAYVDSLTKLKKEEVPALNFDISTEFNSEGLLELIDQGKIDCTLTDSNIFKKARPNNMNLRANFSLGGTQFLAWPLAPRAHSLNTSLDHWFKEIKSSGRLNNYADAHYGHTNDFDYYDIRIFKKMIKTTLPEYINWINEAALKYDFSPKLIAALSFQESHWDPNSTSKTGVRGFMMLTKNTAKSLGVKNRLDAKESIFAGTKYLRQIYERLPSFISPQDRLWMALASYNVGYGHLQDGRRLAIDLGLNPNLWSNVKQVLPKLAWAKYYNRTRYGYARGYEPVAYVKKIRSYMAVLEETELASL